MRTVGVIFGAILVICGVYCLVTPVETFEVLGWLIGFVMLVEGVSSVLTWNGRRKLGFADGWTLVGAIASIVLGAFVVGSLALQLAIDEFLAYLVAAWLVIGGVARIAAAIGLQRFNLSEITGVNWIVILLLGILIVIMGIVCFLHPTIAMAGVGIILGVSIIITGISIIAGSLSR